VCEFASDRGHKPDIVRVDLGEVFVEHGTRPYLYKKYEIDEGAIVEKVKHRWGFQSSK
jgi:transketolase C-terminal domain/subunit